MNKKFCINFAKIFINQNKQSLFLNHFHWNVIYQLEIIFPNSTSKWYFDFSEKEVSARVGKNVFANVFSIIPASGFYSILKLIKGWDYVSNGGYYGSFKKSLFSNSLWDYQAE